MNYRYFTSESVAAGHPDKICDQVSDAILDACLEQDKNSRVAVECMVTVNRLILAGETKSHSKVDFIAVARKVVKRLGYTNGHYNFSYKSPMDCFIHQQSPDISFGVEKGGAGDQGMMFGYATDETNGFLPLPIFLAHRLVERMDEVRIIKILPFLRPDGKSEVKVKYKKGIPERVMKVVLAVPHDPEISNRELKSMLYEKVIMYVLQQYGYDLDASNCIINGTGRWHIGGPASDTGVTGRKIIVDTYGGMGRHGGGCFSGKDPSKVDRSAAYATRFIAKNIVGRKYAHRAEVTVAYVIGRKNPIARSIDTFGTNQVDKRKLERFAWNLLDLSVPGIIREFDLNRPIYEKTAVYGHFGRNDVPWEKLAH